jgi:ribosomal protein S18 acetylase RimI-like enzyme
MEQYLKFGNYVVKMAQQAAEVAACFSVISQLRPFLENEEQWVDRAASLMADGYKILAVWQENDVVAMAGYRLNDNMIHGKFLYVDDLVTDEQHRGSGLGALLLSQLQTQGSLENCNCLVLDTAAINVDARRFYKREGLLDLAVGFVKPLNDETARNLEPYLTSMTN